MDRHLPDCEQSLFYSKIVETNEHFKMAETAARKYGDQRPHYFRPVASATESPTYAFVSTILEQKRDNYSQCRALDVLRWLKGSQLWERECPHSWDHEFVKFPTIPQPRERRSSQIP